MIVEKKVPVYITKKVIVPVTKKVVEKVPVYVPKYIHKVIEKPVYKVIEKPVYKYIEKPTYKHQDYGHSYDSYGGGYGHQDYGHSGGKCAKRVSNGPFEMDISMDTETDTGKYFTSNPFPITHRLRLRIRPLSVALRRR